MRTNKLKLGDLIAINVMNIIVEIEKHQLFLIGHVGLDTKGVHRVCQDTEDIVKGT